MFATSDSVKTKKGNKGVCKYVCLYLKTTTFSQKGRPLPKNTNYLNKSIPTNF